MKFSPSKTNNYSSFLISLVIAILSSLMLNSCDKNNDLKSAKPNVSIIPFPKELESTNSFSTIRTISLNKMEASKIPAETVDWLSSWSEYQEDKTGTLFFKQKPELKSGAYILTITGEEIIIEFKDQQSVTYALASLRQLLNLNNGKLPVLAISDEPGFQYRGMHLDVARHMFSVDEIKKYIDYLAVYKFNYFHWHLTDDQGWRIEIKKYPKIQEVAAFRNETLIGHYNDQPHAFDNHKYGGYYSHEEIKTVIQYAESRGIEVIPEIDIPGHSSALIAAYPELSCHGNTVQSATKWGVFFDILCPTENTFEFLENVFDEVAILFPSKYIHIGGDECPKEQWKASAFCQELKEKENLKDEYEIQSYFIKRIETYLSTKGKQIIGWDEILEGGLAPNATVMSWRGVSGGIKAAQENHNVIMTPTSHCYFDYYQSESPDEPVAIGGYLPFQKVYNWNPIPEELDQSKRKYILGGQANVWTEYIKVFTHVEYMSLARMITLSEVLWGKNSDDLSSFSDALFEHTIYWKAQNVNIANHLLDTKMNIEVDIQKGVFANLDQKIKGSRVFCKKPLSENFELLDQQHFPLSTKGEYLFKTEKGDLEGNVTKIEFNPHPGNFAEIKLKNEASQKYPGNGAQSLINGILGFDDRYGGTEWLGFDGDDFEAEITFNKQTKLNSVDFRFFNGEGQWIYLPKSVKIFNGNELLAQAVNISSEGKLAKLDLKFPSQNIDTLKIKVENFGTIPDGKQGSGHKSWLFIDEIVLN